MSKTIESNKKIARINGDREYRKYIDGEIKMHDAKMNKKADGAIYESVANKILNYYTKDVGGKMICLGTRNNHERDCFREFLKSRGIAVYSQDIAPSANADFTGDFNILSTFLPNQEFDILYSNSIDHAIDATIALQDWMKVVKSGGIICLGISYIHSKGDNCTFSQDNVIDYINSSNGLQLLGYEEETVNCGAHYFMKKI